MQPHTFCPRCRMAVLANAMPVEQTLVCPGCHVPFVVAAAQKLPEAIVPPTEPASFVEMEESASSRPQRPQPFPGIVITASKMAIITMVIIWIFLILHAIEWILKALTKTIQLTR